MRRAAVGLTSIASVAAMAEQKTIVIGGGVTGVCTAYYLARKGRPCTLIDPVGIAPAASGKAGGFLALDWNDGSAVGPLARASFHLHEELAKSLEIQNHRVDYRRLTCEAVAAGAGGAMNQRKLAGVEWADLNTLGSSSLGSEATIAQVHPKKLCEALIAC